MAIEHQLNEAISKRTSMGNLRSLNTTSLPVDFFSNDYLGLAHSQELWRLIKQNYDNLGHTINGATGSRLLSGNTVYCEQLEDELASLFKSEATLLFNSGYLANQAVLSSIPQKDDTIIYDEKIHACIKEGARLSFAKFYSFKHNDISDLSKKLELAKGNVFVVVESIYSMDGDQGRLEEILAVCKKYKANLIIDEAHSTGILGENGNGLTCKLGIEKEVFLRIYTFGKGIGVHGACVAGSQVVKDYLVNFARPFIYTTALPSHNLVSIRSAFNYLKENPGLQQKLKKVISHFKSRVREYFDSKKEVQFICNDSAIQVVVVPGNDHARKLALSLQAKGFDVRPILSPTVKEGEERIRICLHAYNTNKEIDSLVAAIFENTNG